MLRKIVLLLASLMLVTPAVAGSPSVLATAASTFAAVPHFDHVVIVVEENKPAVVIGNPNAPYLTSLANANANFTHSYGVTHPSQPNYLALFSGSTQGQTDDSCPHSFSSANLGASLIGAGRSFTGYSEDLPADPTVCASGAYARKHNPWSDFTNVPAASDQPMSAFPTDYNTLPAVSFVVPNLRDDMHDGTIAQGDSWLHNTMDGYVQWAKTHNSLFVLTFDEDDGSAANRIATIMAGQRVRPGNYAETINHYNVLSTITTSFGLAGIGNAAAAPPITDIWTPPAGDTAPTAAFTSSCTQLACSFNASTSTDPEGPIAGYSWDFGDGSTASGTGATTSHTFGTGGTYSVRLTVYDNQGAPGSVTQPVTVAATTAPTVTAVSPTSGPVSGGQTVTVTGTGFTGTTAVTFGTTAGTSIVVVSATKITVRSPAHAAGLVDLRVTTPGGTSPVVTADRYTFAASTVTGVSPTSGPVSGGQTVTVTGTGFTGTTAVTFGTTAGTSIVVVSATKITVRSPAHAAGLVDLRVTAPGGTSPVVTADRYTFAASTVTGVSPTSGPVSGGQTVTVTGTGFTGTTAVTFGTTAGTSIVVVSATKITVRSPAHAAGLVDLRVTTPGGTSAIVSSDHYTFV